MTGAALADVVVTAADLVVAAGLALGLGVLASTRSLRTALPVLLDLLLAAGLLRLASATTWKALAGAAAVVLLRKLVVATLVRDPEVRRQSVAGRA